MANSIFSPVESKENILQLANLPSEGAKENAADLAGSRGVGELGQSFKTKAYLKRAEAATALCHAIAECEPEDAAPIMEAALSGMCAGTPMTPLLLIMDHAAWWADFAIPMELDAYALACVNRMAPKRKAAFLAYVGGAQ